MKTVNAKKQVVTFGNQMSIIVKVDAGRKVNSCGNKAQQRLN